MLDCIEFFQLSALQIGIKAFLVPLGSFGSILLGFLGTFGSHPPGFAL